VFAHGQLVYLQIPATDITASAHFYASVFGWEVEGGVGSDSGFEAPGLIGQWITDRPAAPDAGAVMWIHVDNVAQTLTDAERAGAVLRMEPTPDGPRLLASFSDPAGNLVGIVAHGAQDPARTTAAATPTATAGVESRTMPPCTIIPELVYDDVTAAIQWLCDTFGFEERWHAGDHRAQLSFGNGTIAITEPRTSRALAGHVSLVIRVDDADAHCRRARERGATIVAEPHDYPYGERQYTAEDLGGHRWCFSQSIADLAPEEWGGTSGPALGAATHDTSAAPDGVAISVMLIVPEGDAAVAWYREALGAEVLWDLGGVAGLKVGGAPFFLHEANPDNPAEDSPDRVGQTSVRIEVFVDDPDTFIARAVAAGAQPGSPVTAHELPWGTHRQGGFQDPFGHKWSVGDTSPLRAATR
jgi:PhnB protein